jgi:prepilin-type N-terminal cleavage/methylation domain-containing protein
MWNQHNNEVANQRISNKTRKEKDMLKKLRSNKGFTLIELLIVVAIIGILAAIAIPQFAAYREKAYNSAANSDVKNWKTGQEAFNADFQTFPAAYDAR